MEIRIRRLPTGGPVKVHTDRHWTKHVNVTYATLNDYFGEEIEVRHG